MKKYSILFVYLAVFIFSFSIFVGQVLAALSFGSEYQFNNQNTNTVDNDSFDSTHFVVAYSDIHGTPAPHTTTEIGTVSGTSISYSSDFDFDTTGGSNWDTSIAVLDTTNRTFVVAWKDSGSSNEGKAVIGTVNAGFTSITYGTPVSFNAGTLTEGISVSRLDNTHFVISYEDNSANGQVVVGEVSGGDTITFGSEATFDTSGTLQRTGVVGLSSSYFVVAFSDAGSINYGRARVGYINTGVDPKEVSSWGSQTQFNTATGDLDITDLSASKVAISFIDLDSSNNATTIIGDVSGTAITFGSEYVYHGPVGSGNSVTVEALNSSTIVAAAADYAAQGEVGVMSSTSISYDPAAQYYDLGGEQYPSIANMDGSKFVISFAAGDSTEGFSKTGENFEDPIVSQFSSQIMAVLLGITALGLFGLIVMFRGRKIKGKKQKK